MKELIILFLFFSSLLFGESFSLIKMRELVEEIARGDEEKIIILQNGSNIYYNDGILDKKFLEYVDGAGQESFLYGSDGEVGRATSLQDREYLLKRLIPLEREGKKILTINYSNNKKDDNRIKKINKKYNFIGERIKTFSANYFNTPLNPFSKKNIQSINEVENFLYILNPNKFKNKKEYYNALKNTNYDLIIIDPSFNGEFFSKSEIERLKYKKSGEKRLLIAYFSIGEAENYREYWEKEWDKELPNWIVKENENWEGNYIVKYWSAEWKEIIKKYQDKLDEIGVDGYYLDTIDSFEFFE